ncbi:hypothetical protein AUR64_09010 [Haloprofundus marisrubri]|uniref:Alpha/beta hydrolase n=1 Tax=Haloprofundus marisrubri TaxID=1514971 RepID=A0A0W1R9H8_9EURY|nr:alpha/beta hydrolase [Haloprofundus marisrubri]KTG09765.1 hypothetical protein AUR64_09010 [Haloprofundus marisrubri]
MQANRRQFVRGTGAAIAGLGVLGGVGAVDVAAAETVPYVSTREHFDDDGNLTDDHDTFDYGTVGDVAGIDTDCVSDLVVVAHGWKKKGDDGDGEAAAEAKFADAETYLSEGGYDGTVVGYSWDSDEGSGWDFGWGTAKDIAQANGYKLAQFALDYKLACPDGHLRFASHSLGAQVVFNCLRILDRSSAWTDRGFQIRSIHPFGAATDNEVPTDEEPETFAAVRDQVGSAHNYYSDDDSVLAWVYNTIEFDQALGETGAESGNQTPENYTDYDVTDSVGSDHSGYLSNEGALMASHMN